MNPEIQGKLNRKDLFKLSLASLGVVFGDIGTSPLYAIKESLNPEHGVILNEANVFGVLSLVFWSLSLVVTLKYLCFILKADNHGEGGITALLALLMDKLIPGSASRVWIISLGLLGAGLLYGDGIITPAISVLSAIEGLEVATPAFKPYVVTLTLVVLAGIFALQNRGTAKIGAVFGPITLVWFFTLFAIGLPWILKRPDIFKALNPFYAVQFFILNGKSGALVLGSVVLCITGGEALYADMGHFGKRPIRISWYAIVFPALIVNYFGQGALVLEKGAEALQNTFYGLVSGWLLYPLVFISTLAAVIASQALISGAFSLTQQTVQLGFLPRTKILHTSREKEGQIYVPFINAFLFVACAALVVEFRESTRLAASYGIAVTATMMITTILFYLVSRKIWDWSLWKALPLASLFLLFDLPFFVVNLTKIAHGGWIPVSIALFVLGTMTVWKRGRQAVLASLAKNSMMLPQFFAQIEKDEPSRVKGTAVFLALNSEVAPYVLVHHYRHNKVLHEKVILLTIRSEHVPEIPGIERIRVTDISHGFSKVVARYGYMETPDVAEILNFCNGAGMTFEVDGLSFYLGRESFVIENSSGLERLMKRLFIILSRNSSSATEFFKLPPDQVIEIGARIQI